MDQVLIFDGCCNLCAGSVRFLLRHERGPTLRFAPLQSAAGARLLREFGFDPKEAWTVVLVSGGAAYVRSDAALRLAAHLRWPWRLLGACRFVPRPLRDGLYDALARRRFRWFGCTEACLAPSPELQTRFLRE